MHIKALDTGLSRSTVYRNLKLLVDEKIIEKTSTPVGPDKYALVKEKEYNVVCTECGKIMSFDYDMDLNELSSAVYNQTKISIPLNYLSFKGICDECKNKIK
jgi:Fe2+ or Zn2+ uptake regulation protein